MLDLRERRVVVVGHGPVGQRKARAVREAGADLLVVDPLLNEPYRVEHLEGASLVFACATPEVNATVVTDSKARGIWVNAASDPQTCDFLLPAVVRSGDLAIAISTGGAAPALARRLREKLQSQFDAAFGVWVKLLEEMRVEVLACVSDAGQRRELLDHLADWPWLERLRRESLDSVRHAMRARIAQTVPRRENEV